MSSAVNRPTWVRISAKVFTFVLISGLAFIMFYESRISAQDYPPPVGRIEGDDLEVATTTPNGLEKYAAPTVVATGSEVTVRSGHALISLNAGGEVSVCGPARFKVIKSGDAVTLALDYGQVHPSLGSAETFTIYTPTIVATPIAISGGRRDTTLGLEQNGEMCVLTSRGAMRVEPQFAEQSVIIPQGGNVSLVGGQIQSLHADPSACSCDYPRAAVTHPKAASPAQPPASSTVGTLAHSLPLEQKKVEETAAPAESGESPVYTVLMPPLTFNSSSPEPPPAPDPETILLVREVRLRPAAVFRGRVNPAPAQATARPVAPPPSPVPAEGQPLPAQPNFLDRVRNFFHKLASTNRRPCSGAACSG